MKDITKEMAKARFWYHATMLDVNNILNQLGIRDDITAEEKAKYHTMTIFTDIIPRLDTAYLKELGKRDRA